MCSSPVKSRILVCYSIWFHHILISFLFVSNSNMGWNRMIWVWTFFFYKFNHNFIIFVPLSIQIALLHIAHQSNHISFFFFIIFFYFYSLFAGKTQMWIQFSLPLTRITLVLFSYPMCTKKGKQISRNFYQLEGFWFNLNNNSQFI